MTENRDLLLIDGGAALRSTALRLHDDFDGVFSLETVERYLHETFASLERQARVNRFLPLLAERQAREQLQRVASWRVLAASPAVLFVSADDGRSRMAQALLRRRVGESVRAWASVAQPGRDSDLVALALAELGIPQSSAPPLRYDDELVSLADVVVTLGGEACPLVEGHRYEDWTPGSRVDRTLDDVRRSRDVFMERVDNLAAELGMAAA